MLGNRLEERVRVRVGFVQSHLFFFQEQGRFEKDTVRTIGGEEKIKTRDLDFSPYVDAFSESNCCN